MFDESLMVMSKNLKIIIAVCTLILIMATIPFVIYLKVLPKVVSSVKVQNLVKKELAKTAKVELDIKNPELKTSFSPVLVFKVDKIKMTKNNETLLYVKNFNTVISFSKILKKRIVLKQVGLDDLFLDVNKITELFPQEEQKEKQKSQWRVQWFDSLMYLKRCYIVYKLDKDTTAKILGENMEITSERDPKYVRFDLKIDLNKNNQTIKIALSDNGNVYIQKRKLYVKNGLLGINNSKLTINSVSDDEGKFDLTVFSKKFDVKNVVELLESNLIVPNGKEMLIFFKDMKGDFDFKVNMTNEGLNGAVKLSKINFTLIPMSNLPVTLSDGLIVIKQNDIELKDFKGWYGSNKKNKIEFFGTVKDYTKSVNINIEATGVATNELTKDYISKLAGCPLTLTGDSNMKMYVKSIYNKFDILWMTKIAKGKDILVDGASLSPVNYDRALTADLHFENNLLNIKKINYYIASVIDKNSKGIKPILTISGNVDCAKLLVKDLGFEIPKPLPSEFLNVLIGQRMFKKGTIAGKLRVIEMDKTPKLDGDLKVEGVRLPSLRLAVNEGNFYTDKNRIYLTSKGRYKRSKYELNGNMVNELIFPVIIKNINLTVDNIDIDRLMKSFNNQNTNAVSGVDKESTLAQQDANEEDYDSYTFDTGLLVIEECILHLVKGSYKTINIGNLKANLTLDKNGVLEVKSNRFDFAEGISSCKVVCDLKNHLYSVKLGVKDIDSDVIATSLLALKKEISGKASGIIEINTDDSLKLNGIIKFVIKDGTIGKVGLIEYALKFASLFRNPMAMISPSTLVDLVNIPEGNFDKINGDLVIKNNVIEKIMIKSSAPQLSSFIIGRFDLESRDATLRIYTKFSNKNKGFAGALRNLSLNSLANRVSLSGRNDSLYYAAELEQLPPIDADERDCQVFLTKVDGDVERNNFLSSLKKIK